VQAHPSLPAAEAYLARGGAPVLERHNGTRLVAKGYELYFTVILRGVRTAMIVKVCEDRRGRVTGASSISYGDVGC
jgi:hypothetical protein